MLRRLLVFLAALMAALAAVPGAQAAPTVVASGAFTAAINPATLTATARGATCVITAQGDLHFTGTLEGTASGTTTVKTLAPCDEVVPKAPGTFRDVFRADLTFSGTLDGTDVDAAMTYQGVTSAPDGAITGQIILSDGLAGALRVDAVVLEGGTYEGVVVQRS